MTLHSRVVAMRRFSCSILFFVLFVPSVVALALDVREPVAAPSVFLGVLQSETLIPRRHDSCENIFGDVRTLSEGEICVSNSCGFGEALVRIKTPLFGNARGAYGVLRYELGEWCKPEFPLNRDVLLVVVDAYHAADGEHEFKYERTFETVNGRRYFIPEKITAINGIDLLALAKPLPEPLRFGKATELSGGGIDRLQSLGIVKVSEDSVVAEKGVYISDLVSALHNQRR
jgi:hypothetical protein